jgi:hypothetical protein
MEFLSAHDIVLRSTDRQTDDSKNSEVDELEFADLDLQSCNYLIEKEFVKFSARNRDSKSHLLP